MTTARPIIYKDHRLFLRKILIPTYQCLEICEVQSILYIEALENYCRVFLNDGSSILSSQSFGRLSLQLLDFGFFQCHKSYTINFSYVSKYHKTGQAELTNGKHLPVARRRKEDFMRRLTEWCTNNNWFNPSSYLNTNKSSSQIDNR